MGYIKNSVYRYVVGNARGQREILIQDLMDFKLKVVTKTPITKLWTDEGLVDAERGRQLTTSDIKTILTEVTFVVADVGLKLNWIGKDKTFDFWKNDLQMHFWDKSDKITLDLFPDGYAYMATEWIDKADRKIVLLEKIH
jgi:hypothetical protein